MISETLINQSTTSVTLSSNIRETNIETGCKSATDSRWLTTSSTPQNIESNSRRSRTDGTPSKLTSIRKSTPS